MILYCLIGWMQYIISPSIDTWSFFGGSEMPRSGATNPLGDNGILECWNNGLFGMRFLDDTLPNRC